MPVCVDDMVAVVDLAEDDVIIFIVDPRLCDTYYVGSTVL